MQSIKNAISPELILWVKDKGKEISELGWIETKRKGNTGIGYTYEHLLGIKENNSQDADIEGKIEVKSHRLPSKSMLTLFTYSPKGVIPILLHNFGQINSKGYKTLHTTVRANKLNSYKKMYGFKTSVNFISKSVNLEVICLKTGSILLCEHLYEFREIEMLVRKIEYTLLVGADKLNSNGIEKFKYQEPRLLRLKSFENFVRLLDEGVICLDIRVGTYTSGKRLGLPHDHGTGFRIHHRHLDSLFEEYQYE